MTTWFDGRFVVLAPDRSVHPRLTLDDRGDAVELLQRLLVESGAEVDVDGIFGPGTEAAVEAFHLARFGGSRSWVGSDTWTELGVPDTVVDTRTDETLELPGAISLAVTLTDGSSASQSDTGEFAILRPDGIGPFDLGRSARDVEAWLVGQLGEPDAALVEPGQRGWPLESCAERRFAYWAEAGFTVGFTDLTGYDAEGDVPDCDDSPHLAGWYVVAGEPPWFAPNHADPVAAPLTVRLTTPDGIELGSPASELTRAFPNVDFGEWYVGEFFPATFHSSDTVWGRVTWNATADLQRALNQRGASLAVDGRFGPLTSEALIDFQIAEGITELEPGGDPATANVGILGAPDACRTRPRGP